MGQFSLSTVAQQPRSCRPFQCHVNQMHVPLVVVLSLIFRVECHHLLTNGTAAFSGHLDETTCILFIFLFGTWLHTTTIERNSSFVTLKFCHRGHPGDLHMPGAQLLVMELEFPKIWMGNQRLRFFFSCWWIEKNLRKNSPYCTNVTPH